MKQINVAIIGYGRSGRDIHTDLLKQLPDQYLIVYYADTDAQRRQLIKDELDVPVFDHYGSFLEHKDEIDLVVNASFSNEHADISKNLLKHGFTVLSEKPAAKDFNEFKSIMEIEQQPDQYFVFHQYRFSPLYLKMREIMESGVLGRIIQYSETYDNFSRRWDWQTIHGMAGGSLLNTGPHPMDHAMDVLGFPDDFEVFCMMDRAHTFGDAEDFVRLIVRAEDKPLVDISISSANAYGNYLYLVQGTRGTLKGDYEKLEWTYYKDEEAPFQQLIKEPLRNAEGLPIYCRENLYMHTENWQAVGDDKNDFNARGIKYYQALYETLTSGKKFPITNEQVSKVMLLSEKAYRQNKFLFGGDE